MIQNKKMMGVRPETFFFITASPVINQIKSEPKDVNLAQSLDGKRFNSFVSGIYDEQFQRLNISGSRV